MKNTGNSYFKEGMELSKKRDEYYSRKKMENVKEIKVGDRVRSLDFPGIFGTDKILDCYIEGIVEAIEKWADCERYKIKCTKRVIEGKETKSYKEYCYPPINGIPIAGTDRVTEGVTVAKEE